MVYEREEEDIKLLLQDQRAFKKKSIYDLIRIHCLHQSKELQNLEYLVFVPSIDRYGQISPNLAMTQEVPNPRASKHLNFMLQEPKMFLRSLAIWSKVLRYFLQLKEKSIFASKSVCEVESLNWRRVARNRLVDTHEMRKLFIGSKSMAPLYDEIPPHWHPKRALSCPKYTESAKYGFLGSILVCRVQ